VGLRVGRAQGFRQNKSRRRGTERTPLPRCTHVRADHMRPCRQQVSLPAPCTRSAADNQTTSSYYVNNSPLLGLRARRFDVEARDTTHGRVPPRGERAGTSASVGTDAWLDAWLESAACPFNDRPSSTPLPSMVLERMDDRSTQNGGLAVRTNGSHLWETVLDFHHFQSRAISSSLDFKLSGSLCCAWSPCGE
jgi:hypothetical protein